MKPRHTITGLFSLLAMAFAAVPAWSADPVPQEAQRIARTVARSLDLQTEIPSQRIRQKPASLPPRESRPLDPGVMRLILWGAILLIAVVAVTHVRRNLWSNSRSRRLTLEGDGAVSEAAAKRMGKAQARADGIADAGGFAEAMHLLLLQSVNELRRRLDVVFADSLTSREILYAIEVAPEARAAFADIISRVELSYFGARDPGKEDYEACRRSYDTLAASLNGARPRENPI